MSVLSQSQASSRITTYNTKIENVKDYVRKNFEDMDLENNNRRDEMEALVEEIETKCNETMDSMNCLTFE